MTDTIKTFNSDIVSLQLLESLTKGLNFDIPDIDLNDSKYQIPEDIIDQLKNIAKPITIDELTSTLVDGPGVFDKIMTSFKNHLKEEFDAQRITGAEYTNAYIALVQAALQGAIQFLLAKDKASLEAALGAINGINAVISNATAKVQLASAQAEAHTRRAQYSNAVLQLATQDAQYEGAKEQAETSRAQTQDTRTDGSPVQGTVERQNKLLEQQKESFARKDEANVLKNYTDAILTAKTQDPDLNYPTEFQNENVDKLLIETRKKVGLEIS